MPDLTTLSPRRMLRIGWVGLGPFSFYGHYIHVLNSVTRPYNFYNMRVTHLWADDYRKNFAGTPEYVDELLTYWTEGENSPREVVKKFNIPNRCEDYHDMVDEVDAAMIMDFDRAHELAVPFIERGLPVFLCSPVAVNVPACEQLLDLAEKHGSAVYSGSFTTGMHENKSRYYRVDRDQIASYFSATSHQFFTSYANDGLEPVHQLIGPGVRRVALHGWNGSAGYDPTGIPVSRIHLEYEPRDGNPPIQGTLTLGGNKPHMEWFKVYYRNHTTFEGTTDWAYYDINYRDFLIDLQEVFMTNKSPETRDDILNRLRVVIAAYKSANEGGRAININEIGDYRLPTVRIEHWDRIPEGGAAE